MIKLFKLLIPPIFYYQNIRKLINLIFFKKEKTRKINFEKNFYKRHAFINKAIGKFENCKYLEIGVCDNNVFNSIPLKMIDKFGVDPVKGGNYKMTSNSFFKEYNDLKFDVIFIDGLHEYKQCQTDFLNSVKSLNKGGVIFLHDLLPRSFLEEKVPQQQDEWVGDVWKVAVEISNSENIDFRIINIDHGVGVAFVKENFRFKKIDNIESQNFNDFLKVYQKLKIINSEEALNFIDKNLS